MHIPKNYFHDRLVLLVLSANTFLAIVTTILLVLRLDSADVDGVVSQYHANLGRLSAFEPGSASTFWAFIVFALFVLVFHAVLSMRMYHHRRHFAVAVLWMGFLLLALALIVSNALSVLQ